MKTRTVRINVVIDATADNFDFLTKEEFEAMNENEILAYCLEYDIIQQFIEERLYNRVAITSFQYVTESDEDDDEED